MYSITVFYVSTQKKKLEYKKLLNSKTLETINITVNLLKNM